MATEAQKLITMSLNKIAVSRQQRGGLNLHKSLLVSHVLMQAKNIYIMENYQAVMQARNVMENNNVTYNTAESSKCVDVPAEYDDQTNEMDNAGHPVHNDDSAEIDKENQDCKNMDRDSAKTGCMEYNEENCEKDTKDLKMSTQCSNKSTKRRLDDITNCQNSVNNQQTQTSDCESDAECSGAKRIKLEDNCVSSSASGSSSSYTPCNNAPVSRADCKQISSLVNRFSVGFSGLLNTDRRQTSEEAINRNPYVEENSCHVQGPVDSPVSCSSQIAGFSPVTPQAIALTV